MDIREDYTIDVLEGHSTKINCEVHGNPPPKVTWYKGNDTSGTMINTNGTLMFTETVFNDNGWYTCFAENILGNVTVTVHLRVGKLYGFVCVLTGNKLFLNPDKIIIT